MWPFKAESHIMRVERPLIAADVDAAHAVCKAF